MRSGLIPRWFFAAMLIIGPAVDACAKASVADCLAGIRQPLMKGAFTGPMDCDSAEIKLKLVGTVRARGYICKQRIGRMQEVLT
jgi:hypothetical protein